MFSESSKHLTLLSSAGTWTGTALLEISKNPLTKLTTSVDLIGVSTPETIAQMMNANDRRCATAPTPALTARPYTGRSGAWCVCCIMPRSLLECIQFVRRTAVQTAVHVITTATLIALLTGIAMKLRWFGPN